MSYSPRNITLKGVIAAQITANTVHIKKVNGLLGKATMDPFCSDFQKR